MTSVSNEKEDKNKHKKKKKSPNPPPSRPPVPPPPPPPRPPEPKTPGSKSSVGSSNVHASRAIGVPKAESGHDHAAVRQDHAHEQNPKQIKDDVIEKKSLHEQKR